MDNHLTDEDMEKTLLEDSHIISILPSEKWMHLTIDESLWPQNNLERSKHVINYLNTYINLKYIIDDFETNHFRRREWRDGMVQYSWFNDYYSANALKWGKIFLVPFNLLSFKEYAGKNEEQYQQLKADIFETIPHNSHDYDTRTTIKKVALVKEIKNNIYTFLTFLSTQHPVSSL